MYKQVILIRKDLNLSKGKLAAQACHASLESYRDSERRYPKKTKKWLNEGGKKVILWVEDEEELIKMKRETPNKYPKKLIKDAGRTELKPGTVTTLGIGPWEEKEMDRYTGHLKTVN